MQLFRHLLLAALLTAPLCAQPPAETKQSPAQPAAQPSPEEDREALKTRLQRRLEETQQLEERLERALKMLEEGESTERVREEAGPPRRFGPGPRRFELRRDGHEPGPGGPPDREAMLRFLERNNPELAERLRRAAAENPDMVERSLQRFEPHFREVMAERDAEMRQMRIENMRLGWDLMSAARDYGRSWHADAASEQTQEARQRVQAILGQHFDMQVKLHQREIQLLEQRIARLRAEAEQQSGNREEYIQNKLNQIEQMSQRMGERDSEAPPHGPKGPGPRQR